MASSIKQYVLGIYCQTLSDGILTQEFTALVAMIMS